MRLMLILKQKTLQKIVDSYESEHPNVHIELVAQANSGYQDWIKAQMAVDSLPEIQYSILANGAEYVKVGGRLLYSTCTLSKAENEGVTERFLKENRDFEPAYFNFNNEKVHNLTLMPHKNKSDGFYICVFKRIK